MARNIEVKVEIEGKEKIFGKAVLCECGNIDWSVINCDDKKVLQDSNNIIILYLIIKDYLKKNYSNQKSKIKIKIYDK